MGRGWEERRNVVRMQNFFLKGGKVVQEVERGASGGVEVTVIQICCIKYSKN